MSTRVLDKDGNELWGPDIFGKYSIDKIEAIAKIMEQVLKNTTINFKEIIGEDGKKENYYTKTETDDQFFRKADFDTIAKAYLVSSINQYLNDIKSTDGVASNADVNTMRKVANYLTKACFDQTYQELESTNTLSINPIPTRLDNAETSIKALDTNVAHMMDVMYQVNHDGSFSSTVKLPTAERFNEVNNKVDNNVNSIVAIRGDIANIRSILTTLTDTTSFTNITNINNRLTAIETKLNEYDNFKRSVETRLSALEQHTPTGH